MAESDAKFEPHAIPKTLDRHRVNYIAVGGFARVIQGTEEMTRGLDIAPSMRKREPAQARRRP